jgi:hypothetical protein
MSRTDDLLAEIRDSLTKNQTGNSAGFRQSTDWSNPFSSATTAVNGFTGAVGNVLKEWQTATSTFGTNWNNDAIGLHASVAKSRMSMAEWADSIQAAGSGFAGLGGTMNESGKIFTSVATSFRDSGASESLAKMAWTTGEQNKLLAMSMTTQRHLDLSKVENQNLLFESVNKLGKEMDKTTQLYGISRKEQISIMEANKNDMKYQAALNVNVNKEAKSSVDSVIQNTPKIVGDLIKNYVTGGALTEKNLEVAQGIGELAEPLRNAVENLKHAGTKEEAETYKKQIESINEQIAIRMNSTEVQKQIAANSGFNKVATTQGEIMLGFRQQSEGIQSTAENLKISQAEAAAENRKKAELAVESKTGSGKIAAEAASTEFLVKTGRAIEDAAKKPQEAVLAANARFADAVSKKNAEGATVNDFISTIDKKTGEPMSDRMYGDFGKDFVKSIDSGTFIKDIGSMLEKGAIQGLSNIKSISAATVQLMGNLAASSGGSTTKNQFANGTKESFGDWFGKDFGTGMSAILHGNEAVVPKGKVPEFLADMQKTMGGKQANIIENMMNSVSMTSSNLMNQMPQPTIEPVNQAPQVTQETSSGASDITLKDINEQLATLNTSMVKLISTTSDMLETTDKQYRATKQLSPNLNAR